MRHITLEAQNLDVLRKRLRKRGIVIIESGPISGSQGFEISDPFGNRIGFVEKDQ